MKHALTVSLVLLVVARVACFLLFAPKPVDGQPVSFTSVIFDAPQVTFASQTFTVMLTNAFGGLPVRVKIKPSNQFEYGKMVKISGSLTVLVLRGGRRLTSISPEEISVVPSPQDKLMQFVLDIRKTIENTFKNFLSPNSGALLMGIVLGIRGELSREFLTGVQTTGVAHIIAASGMNVTLTGGFFFALFARFFRRQYAIILVGICVGWYVLLSGCSASILRAGVMMFFSLGAQLFGRQYDGMYALFLTACLLLGISPSLLFDIGFQLSVAATVGIVFIKPLFPVHPLVDDVSTTIAAQLTTLPIILAAFSQVGVLSVLVNALILWTIPFLMVLGGVAALCSGVFPWMSGILLYISAPLLWYIEVVVEYFAKHSPVVAVTTVPILLVLGYYVCLGAVVWAVRVWKQRVSLPPLPSRQAEQ